MTHPGPKIAELRKKFGYTQDRLATLMGFSRCYLARVEKEIQEPSWGFISSVAEALGTTVSVMMLERSDLPDGVKYDKIYDTIKSKRS